MAPWTFYNASGQRLSTAATSIDVLDIDGATDIGAAIVDADLFIIDDGAGGTNRKTAASRIKTYVGAAPSQANQAALEAGTNEDTYAPPDLLRFAHSSCKAWISIPSNGVVTPSQVNSENVASVTDTGTGDRLIVFDTDFSTTDYVCAGSPAGTGDTPFCLYNVGVSGAQCQHTVQKSSDQTVTDRPSGSTFWGELVDV